MKHESIADTLVLGIGNTLLADEGAGIHLLNHLRDNHADLPGVTWLDGGTLGFVLAPRVEDCDNLVVLDAAQLGLEPGSIRLFTGADMDDFVNTGTLSVHEVGLADLLSIARLTVSIASSSPSTRWMPTTGPKLSSVMTRMEWSTSTRTWGAR